MAVDQGPFMREIDGESWLSAAAVQKAVAAAREEGRRDGRIKERLGCADVAEKLRAPAVAQMIRARSALDEEHVHDVGSACSVSCPINRPYMCGKPGCAWALHGGRHSNE